MTFSVVKKCGCFLHFREEVYYSRRFLRCDIIRVMYEVYVSAF